MTNRRATQLMIVVAALPALVASSARADSALFAFSSGTRSAEAEFRNVAGNLQVTLTNTSDFDVLVPTDVLTAVYFDIDGNPTLTPQSALLASGSLVILDDAPPGGNVGGEWAFRQVLSAGELPNDQAYGLSSTGLDIFGPHDLIDPDTPLAGPASPNGLQYGILSAGDDFSTGNGGMWKSEGLIHNSIDFIFMGIGSEFDYGSISNVRFQYGTDLNEPSFPAGNVSAAVPEPTSLALLVTGAFGFIGYGWRRKRKLVA